MLKELKYTQLKKVYDESIFNELDKFKYMEDAIGQKKAIEALKFGLSIKNKGYNIYVSGESGSGRTTFSEKYARKIAQNEKTPDDIIYVYNFKDPKAPKLLKLSAGKGIEFKNDIKELIHLLSIEIPKTFNSKEFEEEKDKILKHHNEKKEEIINCITEIAKENNFGIKNSTSGIYFMPIINGTTISEEEYEELSEDEKSQINERSEVLQEDALQTMKSIKELELETKKQIDRIEYNLGLFTIGRHLDILQNKYIENKCVSEYLVCLKEDILDNIELFIEEETEEDDTLSLLPLINKKSEEDILAKYSVNLIVDNSNLKGAPVIVSYNPSYTNLIGEIEFENELGNFTTDYMKIKGGLLHKANGGYLILNVEDILKNSYALESLFRVLKIGEICIEPLKEFHLGGISVSTIKPEILNINVKIILIGSEYYYDVLNEYEEDFKKLFKIHSIFDYEMENTTENILSVAKFIKNFEETEQTLNFDKTAIKAILEYCHKISRTQNMLTTKFNILTEILIEANAWASMDNSKTITEKYVKKAIKKKIEFCNTYEEKFNSMILENDIMIKTDGFEIGQINGLAVLDYGDYAFGKPSKITATTYVGKAGLVNIEKEAELSGNIHNKGVQVISGYLGEKYAFEFPLSLSCRICFEQNYNGVDGDSASSTELYAIISSLSEIPIKQGIAVTGSVNQKGEIQPIGGVTEKIEGFFDICNKRGLTGTQGVIIPFQNVKDLCLKDEVIDAVKQFKFHIYPITSIDEGLEILTDKKAGEKQKNNKFTENSIHFKAMKKLKYFYEKGNEE